MAGNLIPPSAEEERDDLAHERFGHMILEIQGWCPACGGSGVVMEYGPTDCPNVDEHRLLASLEAALPPSFFRGGA